MQEYISGIQQIGIGVKDAATCLRRYADCFGMRTLVFDDVAEAKLMTRYTGGTVYSRQALLSLNLRGGGGFEIWQYRNREPLEPALPPQYGDLGIYAARLKCDQLQSTYESLKSLPCLHVSGIRQDGTAPPYFWVRDEWGNRFQIGEANHWFRRSGPGIGGVIGAVIGVSDTERALQFYQALLNLPGPEYDQEVRIEREDGTEGRYRKTILRKEPAGQGAFGKLLGGIELELVQDLERTPLKIYRDRFWGDCGFIHLCFDVFDMAGLKRELEGKGYPFTVDSENSFEMEAASGRFCYVEDPDGTLIELVETHRVPVFKKWGIYLNLKKRDLRKPLPDWMIGLLALSKVK